MRRESFDTPGPVTLDLRLPSGLIELEAADGEETTVELDATSDSDDVREVIENARIELRRRGDGHEVIVDVQRKRFGLFDFMRGEIVLRVRAPHGADVDLSTASADVDARGRFGSLKAQVASGDVRFPELAGRADVKSASGDVDVGTVAGDASINTASGDVRVERIGGEATVRSASGDVVIDEAESSITVQTASGDQHLGSIASGRVTMQSASGDQHVGIRRGTRVFIDAKTLSGDTTSELEIGDAPQDGEGPTAELRATSMSGDIRIVRA
jgi:Putative adhesin